MDAARRGAPIFVLDAEVDMGELTDEPGHGWTKIECASKKAYGCGERGQAAAEGLTLYAHLGAAPFVTSSLAIRTSDDALRSFYSELNLGCPRKRDDADTPCHHETTASGVVQTAEEQGLTVILLLFRRSLHPDLAYYLVYDHTGASLSMIKYIPDLYEADSKLKPVAKRCCGSDDFELFLMSRTRPSSSPAPPRDVLCVCTPETRANPAASDDGPWRIKERRCFQQEEEIQEPYNFSPDVAFSFQGKGFWADLSQGLVYCDLDTSSTNSGAGDVVDFSFIALPPEPDCQERKCSAQMEMEDDDEEEVMMMDDMITYEPMKLTRTMGCVGDTIWFVCIDRARDDADDLVKMWTLKLPGGKLQEGRWEKVLEVRAGELWGLESFKAAALPEGALQYPVLTADGALCLLLPDESESPLRDQMLQVDDICVFDVHGERLLWHGLVNDYPYTDPVVAPSDFLQREHGSHKRKVDEHLFI